MCLAYVYRLLYSSTLYKFLYSINKRFSALVPQQQRQQQPQQQQQEAAMNRTNCTGFKCNLKHLQNFCKSNYTAGGMYAMLCNDRNIPHSWLAAAAATATAVAISTHSQIRTCIITLIVSTKWLKVYNL